VRKKIFNLKKSRNKCSSLLRWASEISNHPHYAGGNLDRVLEEA